MLSSLLIGYYLHQFSVPSTSVHRSDRSHQYMQTVQPEGNLLVETYSPHSTSVAPGSQRVEMLTMRLTADCTGDVSIETISIQRRGLGAKEDIDALYLVHRGKRISRERAIANRDGSLDISLRDFVVPACDTEDVAVVANFAPTASPAGEHRMELRNIAAGNSHVRIEKTAGNFSKAVRTVAGSVGQIAVEYLRVNNRVRYGSRQLISRFTLSADGVDNHHVSAMTFTNNGTATDDDLQNLYVEFRNRSISTTVSSLDNNTATVTFSPPVYLQKNQTLKFGLRADVRASRSRTIQFVIEEPSDIISAPVNSRSQYR